MQITHRDCEEAKEVLDAIEQCKTDILSYIHRRTQGFLLNAREYDEALGFIQDGLSDMFYTRSIQYIETIALYENQEQRTHERLENMGRV